jgi:hypothetical protein
MSERTSIEPTSEAWELSVPLNYFLSFFLVLVCTRQLTFCDGLDAKFFVSFR